MSGDTFVYPLCPECRERVWFLPRPEREGDIWIHTDLTPIHSGGPPIEGHVPTARAADMAARLRVVRRK